jgi:type I site-specific restriction endonuclease
VDAGAKLSERDICTKFITPALVAAGWDVQTQIREEVGFTKGRIIVRGRLVTRGRSKRADYVLYFKHLPLALIEAKDQSHISAKSTSHRVSDSSASTSQCERSATCWVCPNVVCFICCAPYHVLRCSFG